ncbi:tRNA1(Val) (adenine(37)-N6)-methyltransferase [Clostridium sp. D2Q-14]|nr:tRNA1(Val) (adenine(37)-N6)-methyltransferase [Anaeromonas gelatinilytica]MBS4535917.1 tRNA1(Val) (adenine(37)-N6)-methyltransferase [Anaeromonas gelatinilytica]
MKDVFLKKNERIDDLQLKGLKIIQNTKGFCFGIDAVLLANFCEIKLDSTVVDLGTGTGIIPLIIYGKNEINKIYGIEIQQEVADMAERSVELNGLEENIKILNMDLRNIEEVIKVNSIDVVVSNPPYMDKGTGIINPNDKKAISRHEIRGGLEDIIEKAKRLLKHNGRFYMIHRPNRLVDILYYLRKHKLEPKTLRFIHSKMSEAPNLVLIKSIKAAKPELKIEAPLYVYNEDGEYTNEIHEIYGLDD